MKRRKQITVVMVFLMIFNLIPLSYATDTVSFMEEEIDIGPEIKFEDTISEEESEKDKTIQEETFKNSGVNQVETDIQLVTSGEGTRVKTEVPDLTAWIYPSELDIEVTVDQTHIQNIELLKEEIQNYLSETLFITKDAIRIIEGSKNAVDTKSNFDWWIYDRYNDNPTYEYIEDVTAESKKILTGSRIEENTFNADTGDDALNTSNEGNAIYSYYEDEQIDDVKHQYIEAYTETSIYPIDYVQSNIVGNKGVANWILSRHIKTQEDGSITMYGYGSPAYNDWMYLPNDSSETKVFSYDTHGEIHDALDGTGFLFNTKIDESGYALGEQKINGYLFWVDDMTTTAKLFKFTNVDAQWLHTQSFTFDHITSYNQSGNQIELVASTNLLSNSGYWNRYKIEVEKESVKVWFDASENQEDLEENLGEENLLSWTLNSNQSQLTAVPIEHPESYGFGPFASYQSHGCSRRTSFTYKNLKMFIEVPKKFDFAIDNQYWNNDNPNVIVNISDVISEKMYSAEGQAYVISRLLNDEITYINVGNDIDVRSIDHESESRGYKGIEAITNEIVIQNNGNGAYVNGYSDQLDKDIGDAIISNITRTETADDIMISLGEQIKFKENIKFMSLSESIDEDFPDGNWKFIHTTKGFDRADEIEIHPSSDIPMMALEINFDRPGKYAIFYKDIAFKNVYVSERPEVNMNRELTIDRSVISSDVSYTAIVNDIEQYDYNGEGFETTQEWQYFDLTSSAGTWIDGKIDSVENDDLYIIQVIGKNDLGIKSKPDSQLLVGTGDINEILIAKFRYDHSEKLKVGQEENVVDLNEKSYDPAGEPLDNYFWTLTDPKGIETVLFDDVWSKSFAKIDLSDYGAKTVPGYYLISLKVHQALPVFDRDADSRVPSNEYSPIFSRAIKVEDYTNLEKANMDLETFSINLLLNEDKEHLESDIAFTFNPIYGSSYIIESTDPNVINKNGVVTRPSFTHGNQHVTISVRVEHKNAVSIKDFEFDVIALPPTDEEAVNAEYDHVKVLYYGNEYLEKVNHDLELYSEQVYDTKVTWASSDESMITNKGEVTLLAYGSPSVDVQLVATIERGDYKKTKTFDVTVIADPTPPSKPSQSDDSPSTTKDDSPEIKGRANEEKADIFEDVFYYQKEGKVIASAAIDHEKLEETVEQLKDHEVIDIETNQAGLDIIMHLDDVKDLNEKGVILDIKTMNTEYFLDTTEIEVEKLQEKIGNNVALEEIEFEVTIVESDEKEATFIKEAGESGNYIVKVPPVSFEITAHYKDNSEAVEKFNVFMKRQIIIPQGIDPNAITTAITVDKNDEIIHVPTKIEVIEGVYYAVFNSLTNSSYAIVEHYQHYLDIEDSFAKESITNMGNRMVFEDTNYFGPEDYVSRLEAAVAICRALSIKSSGNIDNQFIDINDESYAPYIESLREYGIVLGIDEDHFSGERAIMRQELMIMLYRAHENFGLESNNEYKIPYSNKLIVDNVADGAKEATLWCQRHHLVMTDENGKRKHLEAQDPITRAQLAEAIDQFLKQESLINE